MVSGVGGESENSNWDDLESDLSKDNRSLLERLLPNFIAFQLFGNPEEQRRLHKENRENTVSEFLDVVVALRAHRERFDESLVPSMQAGDSLPDNVDAHLNQLEDGLHRIGDLQSRLDNQYLRKREIRELQGLTTLFEEYRKFIPVKRRFDETADRLETAYSEIDELAEPYWKYKKYLARFQRQSLESDITAALTEIQRATDETDFSLLANHDSKRLAGLKNGFTEIRRHLDGYNDRFVPRRIDACDDLFTNIDDDGNDLNIAQRKAVVRNDNYNQVIAAAGTGKTLALTYRVAYLVEKESVPPEEILAVTFTKKARREMENRLEGEFGITEVEVSTIHSFAFKIARETSNENISGIDKQDRRNLIERVIHEEITASDGPFYIHYLQFLANYDQEYASEADFEDEAEYIATRARERYETLGGETVASRAEKVIADFLLMHGVDYQYESIAEWAEIGGEKGVYRPDFYLPEYDLYIEHWGLNEAGEVAPWFTWSTEEYVEKLRWARNQFAESDHLLVETYDFEHQRSPVHLERVLQHRLEDNGVTLERMTFHELIEYVFEYHQQEQIRDSFNTFIETAKRFRIDRGEIESRLNVHNPRQYHFGRCGEIMLREYQDYLARNDLVDFDDMIDLATDALRKDPEPFRGQYQHLLVDEFQDVSTWQIHLIQQLVGHGGARLFCVGDDWQSIYGFRAADVGYFVDFEDHFGPAATTYLTKNYRCPETVLEAGNELISNNPTQIEKRVTAASNRDTTPQLHLLSSTEEPKYRRHVGEYAVTLIERCLENGSEPGDVMVLCRYDDAVPHLDNIKRALRDREIPYDGAKDHFRPPYMPGKGGKEFDPDAGVSIFSIHQSKGREAKDVVLVDVVDGHMGFPSEDRTDELIAPVQEIVAGRIPEERRLFYVAITRTKESLHIQSREGRISPFIIEIEDYLERIQPLSTLSETSDETTIIAKVDRFFKVNRHQQQYGYLYDGTEKRKFVSWTNENPPELEKNVWYQFKDVEINQYKNKPEIVIHGDTKVMELYRNNTPFQEK